MDSIEVMDSLFGVSMNSAVVHQVMVAHRANARQGTASTKTRAQKAGGGRKPFTQKGTGRARQGTIRAPHMRGGGVVFGPHPRDYRQSIPKRMKRLALQATLSDKVKKDDLIVLDALSLEKPRTKDMVHIMANLGIDSSTLVVTKEPDQNIARSIHNLQRVKGLPVSLLNVIDLLNHQKLIMTVDVVRKAEELWAGEFVRSKKNLVEIS